MYTQDPETEVPSTEHAASALVSALQTGLAYVRDQLTLPLTLPDGTPVYVFEHDGTLELHIETDLLCKALAAVTIPGAPTAAEKAAFRTGDAPAAYNAKVHQTRITVNPTSVRFTATASGVTCEVEVSLPKVVKDVPEGGVAFLVPQTFLKKVFSVAGRGHKTKDGRHKFSTRRWDPKGFDVIRYDDDASYMVLNQGNKGLFNLPVKKIPVNQALPSIRNEPGSSKVNSRAFASSLVFLEFLFDEISPSECTQCASFGKESMFAFLGPRGVIYQSKELQGLGFDLSFQDFRLLRSVLRNLTAPFWIKINDNQAFIECENVKISFPVEKLGRAIDHMDKFTKRCDVNNFNIGICDLLTLSRLVSAVSDLHTTMRVRIAKGVVRDIIAVEGVFRTERFNWTNASDEQDKEILERDGLEFKVPSNDLARASIFVSSDTATISVFDRFVRFSESGSDRSCDFIISVTT